MASEEERLRDRLQALEGQTQADLWRRLQECEKKLAEIDRNYLTRQQIEDLLKERDRIISALQKQMWVASGAFAVIAFVIEHFVKL